MAATYFHDYQATGIGAGEYNLTFQRHNGELVHAEAAMGPRGCYRLTIWMGEAKMPVCEWEGDLGGDAEFACPDNFAGRVEQEIAATLKGGAA